MGVRVILIEQEDEFEGIEYIHVCMYCSSLQLFVMCNYNALMIVCHYSLAY